MWTRSPAQSEHGGLVGGWGRAGVGERCGKGADMRAVGLGRGGRGSLGLGLGLGSAPSARVRHPTGLWLSVGGAMGGRSTGLRDRTLTPTALSQMPPADCCQGSV